MAIKQKILWDDGERALLRSRQPGGGDSGVLVVRPVAEHPLPATLERMAHEYSLREELDSAWALRPQALHYEEGQIRLLLDDPGGEPLSNLLLCPLDTQRYLRLAVAIAVALRHLHQSGLVHRDLKPNHIQVNCTDGQVRLTGFGLASRLPRQRQAPESPETIAGTLAYMAPEQTGRMNRSIDSRSDLYAFGVVLYQMLTGTLPFTASDPMEWVHCHIAHKPQPPDERVSSVPKMLSQIVLKLLAKNAEERYQSAAGVEHDLRRCLDAWQRRGRIKAFTLDEYGTFDRLWVPEKLYGREYEVGVLVDAFARVVANGRPQLVLVSGYSGIGKSSVVNELHKALVQPRGLFAAGKFDQYKRDIPYSTLVQAFQGLVRTLLGKSVEVLEGWRDALLAALEPNARLITDLIPELRLIIGEQPVVAELEPQQAQRRFLLVLRRFIGVFAREDHPLALFLDDLQWLDAATLDLLEDLLTHAELRHLMLVGAYRDNEVDACHPLTGKLRAIRQAGVRIDEIRLEPLARVHIEQLIAESLRCPPPSIVSLARLVQDKTAGNPFFIIQFLQSLTEEELLTYDHTARRWRWNAERIHAKGYTDNVVDLMVGKLVRLPLETRLTLQQLACLGSRAQIDTLAAMLDLPTPRVHSILWPAVRQELVECQEGVCAFAHDRIHEAAYSLIAEAARDETHLRIGRLLAKQTPMERREEEIFEIVGQLNRGARLIEIRAEREELAEFNLLAGQRAKASSAYSSALSYLAVGAELLDGDCWARRHDLCFALEINRAECEFLTGQLEQSEDRLASLTSRAVSTVEQAAVACLQMDVYLLQDRSDSAVAVCLAYLRAVGISWSAHPDDEQVRREYQQIWKQLGERSIEQLIDLPLMEDAASLATLDALGKLFAPALQSDANLACITICKAVSWSLERGNGDASCMLYANMGRVAGHRFGDYEAGYRFGRLGCELVERRGLSRHEARTYLCFSMFVVRWMRPVRECRALLRRAFVAANRVGDLAYAAYAGNGHISDVLFLGEPLAQVHQEAEQGLAYAQKIHFGLVVDFISTQLALIRTLRGRTSTFGCFDDELFDEKRFEAHLDRTSGLVLAAAKYWIRKLQARYMAGDYSVALHCVAQAKALLWVVASFTEEAEYHFHAALTLTATFDSVSIDDQPSRLRDLSGHHAQLREWAQQCTESFTCRLALVGAEIARVEGQMIEAELLYEEAICQAQDHGFVQIEALANELAGRFYGTRGLNKVARVYLQDACYGYRRWGAGGKVRQLEERHRYLRTEELVPGPTATIATSVEHLDLATVLKVSQAASGEIVLEKLIDMVMRTAIEQAGAERGFLVLADADELRIAAQATVGEGAMLLCNEPISSTVLAESVLLQVLRTGESLCLEDAMIDPAFTADPYIRQHGARSILCMPLVNRAKLTGALYLENNLSANVFNPGRIAVLRLLVSQAAISLENARLYRDVAEREAKIRRLVDANIIGIVVWSADGEIIEANDAFLRMVGYERDDLMSGRVRWHDMTPPECRSESEKALAVAICTGRANPFEKEYIRKDGGRVPVIVGLAAFEANLQEGVAFVLDLTERKQAEERVREGERRYREVQTELAHANRVATMGQLAASIAHEVNQPIAATVTNANAALRWLRADPPDHGEVNQVLGRIIKDANRAAEVLGRIRQLIRKTPPQKQPVDLGAALLEMVEFTRGEAAKSRTVVRVELAEDLPEVEGDRVELQQVMLNLIVNAIEAMEAVPIGERQLMVSTGYEGGGVRVRVSDTGPGFVGGNNDLHFAPFYTTKASGMGMGLSICRSIIDSHAGRLWASSNLPRGAVVQFSLPALLTTSV